MYDFFGKGVWLLIIIGALNWGLDAFGYNLFKMPPFVSMPQVVKVIKLLVGLAGIISLVFFLQKI